MNILKPIKLLIGNSLLKKELKGFSRTKKFYSLGMAESIGIIYEYKDEEEFKVIEQLISQLHDEKKKIKVMVYIKNAKMLAYIPQRLTVDYVRPNEVDWFYRPDSSYVRDFIKTHFHILIDLNYNRSFPLSYIVAKSNAYYKVGIYNEESKEQLDMLLKLDVQNGLAYMVKEMMRYLKIIHSFDGKKY